MYAPMIAMLALMAIGYGLRRLGAFPDNLAEVLNLFVIYVSLPALILLKIPELQLGSQLFVPLILPWVAVLCGAAWVYLAAWFWGWDRPTRGCLLLLVCLGNTSFFGFPMVELFFGQEGMPYAIIYDQVGSFLALVTFGTLVLALHDHHSERLTLKGVLRRILSFPPFLAAVLGLGFRLVPRSEAVSALLESLAGTLIPLVMVAIGYQLRLTLHASHLRPLVVGLSYKLLVFPLAAFSLLRVMGVHHLGSQVALFEAAMPPMVTAGALAMRAGLRSELAAALVGYGLVVSCLTLPPFFTLIR